MLGFRYTGCVYLATNSVNGKIYIGKTVLKLFDRKAIHVHTARRKQTASAFHAALRKHGPEAFVWSRLFESDDEAALFGAEVDLIKDYRTAGLSLYNMSDGGEGQSVPCSSHRRAKVSATMKGRTFTPEHLAALSSAAKGKPKSAEHVARMRQAKTGAKIMPWTEERKARHRAIFAAKRAAKAATSP